MFNSRFVKWFFDHSLVHVLVFILLLESCTTSRPPFYIIDRGMTNLDTLNLGNYHTSNERIKILHPDDIIEVCEAVGKKYHGGKRNKWCDYTYTIELINDSVWHVYNGFIPRPRKAIVTGGGIDVYINKWNREIIAIRRYK